jgi:hypothetical protein
MDSIDIELCRRLAGLAVSFLIELISRFCSQSMLDTAHAFPLSTVPRQAAAAASHAFFSSREGSRSPAPPTMFILVVRAA